MKALIAALILQASPTLETPGFVLGNSSDTAFVVPTHSIGREGTVRPVTLVQIYALGPDTWDTARVDNDVEIDCSQRRIRFVASRSFDRSGSATEEAIDSDWESLEDPFPFFALLEALTCSDADLSEHDYPSLEAELPRLRERLSFH